MDGDGFKLPGMLSFVCGLLYIWCCSKYRSFTQPPGSLALWINVSCTCIDFYYAYKDVILIDKDNSDTFFVDKSPGSIIYECIIMFFRFFSWNLALVLSIEMIQKMPKSKRRRFFYYNIASILASLSLAAIDCFAEILCNSDNKACDIKKYLPMHIVWIYYAYTPFIIWASLVSIPKKCMVSKHLLQAFWVLNLPFAILQTKNIFFADGFDDLETILIHLESISTSSMSFVLFLISLYYFRYINQLEEPLLSHQDPLDHKEINHEQTLEDIPHQSTALSIAIESIISILEKSEDFTVKNLDESHFSATKTHEVYLDQGGASSFFSNPIPITAIEYAPEVYSSICIKDSISKTEIINELKDILNDPDFQDRQQSYSHNFLLRIISLEQLNFINNNLPKVYKHLISTSKNRSLINRIIGVYSFKERNDEYHAIILENVILDDMECNIFELNGSKLVKAVYDLFPTEDNGRTVKNDMDFMKAESCLNLSFADRSMLQKIVTDDLELLKSIGAVEYSLFLAILKNNHKAKLTNRYTRHFFDDGGKLRYAICIIKTYNGTDMISKKKIKQIGGADDYANRFWELLVSITQCQGL
ncbi:hypothetical protein SteCoe_15244 [Stentor coeruleus]|uniref:PIPK domain-containing protein n=1 Tax=Stentor coeruleus TaxID=5963 RepID=A0A1R2C433_9CILI|nr:hypothetical protein SteCoe_15244 [Stentor coeruleus]